MLHQLPLPTTLSHALVAFTIEFDNEAEHRIPHWTTQQRETAGSAKGVWLVSLAMWVNCLRLVGEQAVTVGELERLARTKTNLDGMRRWGYIVIETEPLDGRARLPRSEWRIRPTLTGRRAQEIWKPLSAVIEARWEARFGQNAMNRLRNALRSLAERMDPDLPDCLPILGYGMFSGGPISGPAAVRETSLGDLPLYALLARVLLAFALEFERESGLSLAISANVLRVLDEKGVLIKDLPLLSGVSKEAISMAMGVLGKTGIAVIETTTGTARFKIARLTELGREIRAAYRRTLAGVERHWESRFGPDRVGELRDALGTLAGDGTADSSPLWEVLDPYPDGWRAQVRKPLTLPHYPMVLHRGGYPDGS